MSETLLKDEEDFWQVDKGEPSRQGQHKQRHGSWKELGTLEDC